MVKIVASIPAWFLTIALISPAARAEPTIAAGASVTVPLTAGTLAGATGVGVVLHEAVQALNGKKAFSDSGEGKKALNAVGRAIGDLFSGGGGGGGHQFAARHAVY